MQGRKSGERCVRLCAGTFGKSNKTYYYVYDYHADGREAGIRAFGDASGNATFTYDSNDKLVTLNQGKGDGMDREEISHYVYDNTNQILAKFHDSGKGDARDRIDYLYAMGNPVAETGTKIEGGAYTLIDSENYALFEHYSKDFPTGGMGSYTVNVDGETLQSISNSLYGTPSLWYTLAGANGLTGTERLKAGQVLSVPGKTSSGEIDESAHKTYNENEIIGSKLPNLKAPPPPKKKGCSGLLSILVIVIANVVTIYTAGAAAGLMGVTATAGGAAATTTMGLGMAVLSGGTAFSAAALGAAAIGGAVGSLASQAFAVGVGLQDSINWKGVALSAVGSMVTAGVGSYGAFNIPNSPTLSMGLNAAAGNVASQGLAIAFHQQDKFNWRSVAAAGVATVVGSEIGDLFKGAGYGGSMLQQVAVGGATSITSQLITTGKVDWRSVGAGAFEAVAAQKIQDMKLGAVEKAFADGLVGAGAAAIRKQDVLAGAFVGVANSYVSQKNPTGATKYLAKGLIGAGTAAMNRQDMVAGFIGGGVGTMVGDYLPTAMEKMGVDPMDVGQPRESGKEAAQAFARATALRDSLLNVIAGDIGSGVAKAVANWAGRDMNVAGMIGSGAASQAYDATVQAGREEARKKDIKVNNAAVATKGPYAAPSILQTNSAEDLRAMGYGDLPAGTRLLVNPEEVALEGSGGIQNAGTAPNDDKIAEKIKADQSRVKEIFVDNPSPSAEELILGRRLLHSYGYRTGALEDEITAKNLSVDDKVALLRGEGAGSLKYAKGSAEEFIANDLDELRERNAIFANPSGGVITRQMEDGTSRSIRFSFDQSAAKLAEGIGVSFEEARAKTDWRAYNNVIDAAFNTEDVTSLRFVGLWRPTKELFHSYFADSKEAKFEGKTAQQCVAMDAAVRAAAHIGATWSKQHTRGNAIDIDQLNGGAVNNGVVSAGGAWTKQQSTVMGAFTDSLWNQHPSSLLTPWRIYRVNGKPLFIANNNGAGDAFNHRNHIHFGL